MLVHGALSMEVRSDTARVLMVELRPCGNSWELVFTNLTGTNDKEVHPLTTHTHGALAVTFTGTHMTEHTQLHGWTGGVFEISHDGNPSCDRLVAAVGSFACSVHVHWLEHTESPHSP